MDMMNLLKNAVEKNAKLILDAERYIWQHPETGYKEYETSAYMEKIFKSLGYDIISAGNIPGFYTSLDTGREGPTVLIFGELDSVICPEHPECNKETGAVHSCGHNAQCAALIGIAAALKEEGVTDELCGKIMLCAVPAEELIEIEYRTGLKKDGIIKFFGGKQEFIARGYFDDADLAFMVHTTNGASHIMPASVGIMAKNIKYIGTSSHAGGAPWDGNNALYAANCGLNACNALRETFKEEDVIRFHPIITNGGAIVNAIPGETVIESYVRGASFDAMINENKKINRALIGGALSLGCNIEITDFPGYAPLVCSKDFVNLSKIAVDAILPDENFEIRDIIWSASTDMGDISAVIPTVHPFIGGAAGISHGADYQIADPVRACINSAKMQLSMLYYALKDNAALGKEIMANFKPRFTIPEYIEYMDSLYNEGKRIDYRNDDEAIIKL